MPPWVKAPPRPEHLYPKVKQGNSMKSALENQVDGKHYTEMKLQPMEIAYLIGATPAWTKVAKYTTRKKDDMLQQIDKAIHCVDFEEQFYVQRGLYVKLGMNFVVDKIEEFTDNTNLQNALLYLYSSRYEDSRRCLKTYRKEVEFKEELV